MLKEITPAFIRLLVLGKARHPKIILTISKSDEILLHTEGKGKENLLNDYRPSEPSWIRKHRENNFRLVTKAPFNKICTCLERINRADNFSITFPATDALSKKVAEYTEKDFPQYDSIRNWFFTEGLSFMLTEPNGWCVVQPKDWEWDAMAAPLPVPTLYRAEQALNWEENNFVFLLLDEKSKLPKDKDDEKTGLVYLLVTQTAFIKYTQERDGIEEYDSFGEDTLWVHNFGDLPAFRMGGNPASQRNKDIYESFIAGVLPDWDEALIQASDKQAAIKQHIYPEAAIYGANTCTACKGDGRIKEMGLRNDGYTTCRKCKGEGRVVSPYADIIVRENKDNELPMPDWAPKKYITKDIAPVVFLDEQQDKHIYLGYAAINFEFLAETPLNESGKAKELDRQELNTFVYNIADHIVCNILKPIYWYSMRFLAPLKPIDTLNELQPKITIPKTFDIVTAEVYQAEVKQARESKTDSRIVGAMELNYAKKQFQYEPETVVIMTLTYELDPLYGNSQDDKFTMVSNGGVSKSDYIISCNTLGFVKRALEENPAFAELPRAKQLEQFRKYAAEIDPTTATDPISIDTNGLARATEILAVQTSYFANTIAKDAAKTLLTLLFKLSEPDAEALLQGEVAKPAPPILPTPNPLNPTPPVGA